MRINSALPTAMRSRASREFLRKGGKCVGGDVHSVTFLRYIITSIFRYTLLDSLTTLGHLLEAFMTLFSP